MIDSLLIGILPLMTLIIFVSIHLWLVRRFNRQITGRIRTLITPDSSPFSANIESLPPLIQNFALRSMHSNSLQAQVVRVHQAGEMRLSEQGQWIPFQAVEYFTVRQPGFLWRADLCLAPRIVLTVVDSYRGGQGFLEAKLLGSIPLMNAEGTDLAKGQMMRYLAELPWCPDAFLKNPELQWRILNDQAVELACGEGTGRVAVCFEFDQAGDIVRITSPGRPRIVNNQAVDTPWTIVLSDYEILSGYRVPTRGEVSWELDRTFTYWRGKITGLDINPVIETESHHPYPLKLTPLLWPNPNASEF